MTTTALALRAPSGELDRYMAEVNAIPLLSVEEETALALRWRDHRDMEAARDLVTANLRFVVKIAHEYKGYGLRLLDIVQEGNIGLMHAVKRFDPERGTRLVTYAVFWIRAYIHKFIMDSWNLVKIGASRANRKLFYRLGQIRGLLEKGADERDTARKEMAKDLDVTEQDIEDLEMLVARDNVSIDAPLSDGRPRADVLGDARPNQEERLGDAQVEDLIQRRLHEALAGLDDRERRIIEARYLSDDAVSLRALGDQLGLSGERVRQVEARAFKKLREAIGPAFSMEVLPA